MYRHLSGFIGRPCPKSIQARTNISCSKQPGPPSHCGEGMIFAINPGDRFNQFLKNAAAQGQALAILISVLGAIGNASSFSISAIDNALFNSTIRRRYLR